MLDISAYYKNDSDCLTDEKCSIRVNSAGHYRLLRRKEFATRRPRGRGDYQLIYVNSGSARILLNGSWSRVKEGTVILYRPRTPQYYLYVQEDNPDIYWIHYTGCEVAALLKDCGFGEDCVYFVGCRSSYVACFDKILGELQLKRTGYEALSVVYLEELLRLMGRHLAEAAGRGTVRNKSIETAIRYFHEHYQQDIVIQDYAAGCGMSLCWFIRSFKKYTGMTPQKFIIWIRMTKAKELLEGRVYNVGEVARMIGYPNALYFSRVFRQYTGHAPSRYREGMQEKEQ